LFYLSGELLLAALLALVLRVLLLLHLPAHLYGLEPYLELRFFRAYLGLVLADGVELGKHGLFGRFRCRELRVYLTGLVAREYAALRPASAHDSGAFEYLAFERDHPVAADADFPGIRHSVHEESLSEDVFHSAPRLLLAIDHVQDGRAAAGFGGLRRADRVQRYER